MEHLRRESDYGFMNEAAQPKMKGNGATSEAASDSSAKPRCATASPDSIPDLELQLILSARDGSLASTLRWVARPGLGARPIC